MVKVGLVGLGFMGKVHVGALKDMDGVELVAVADADPKKAAGDLSAAGADNIDAATVDRLDMTKIKGTTDPKELLTWDVDVVDICVPTPFHKDICIAAIESGKHVLCEKPLARTAAEAREIADAAAKAKGFFMPAMCMRFWPQWRWLKEAVENKTYGKVLSASFRRVAQMPGGWFGKGEWSGGALLDLHIHDTDFVYHLFGMPRAVTSRGYSKTTGEIDHIVTEYVYDGSDAPPMVYSEGGWCLADGFGFSMRYTVNFENATADFDFARDEKLHLATGGKKEEVKCDGVNGYIEELKYFFDCVRKGEKPTMVTGEDAYNSIRLTEAEGESVKTGKTVSL